MGATIHQPGWVGAVNDQQIVVEHAAVAEMALSQCRNEAFGQIAAVEHNNRVGKQWRLADAVTVGAMALHRRNDIIAKDQICLDRQFLLIRELDHTRERHDQRRQIGGDWRNRRDRLVIANSARRKRELVAQRHQCRRPGRRCEIVGGGIEMAQRWPPPIVEFGEIHRLHQTWMRAGCGPVLIVCGVALPVARAECLGIHLKRQICQRQLAVEFLAEMRHTSMQGGAHTLAVAIADLIDQVVLQHRKQRHSCTNDA